jgi:hypothetical protein
LALELRIPACTDGEKNYKNADSSEQSGEKKMSSYILHFMKALLIQGNISETFKFAIGRQHTMSPS